MQSNHGLKMTPRNRAVQPRKSNQPADRTSIIRMKLGRRSEECEII